MTNGFNKIDKQLRTAGRISRLLVRPSKTGLRLLNWMTQRVAGRDMDEADSQTVWIDRADGNGTIRTRVFRPKNPTHPLPIILYIHGGGYATGVPEQSLGLLKGLMNTRECVIVAPDYRLSLDAPYPAGLHDCYDGLQWAKDHAAELGGRSDQIFVIGESAGGGLAIAVCLLARDKGEINIAFQMPLYPMIDDRQTSSSTANNMPVWNSKHNKVGWDLYLQDLRQQGKEIPAYAAPARASSYADLPPAATFVGSLDPFLDETTRYVENLNAAGIPVEFKVFDGCYHGFEQLVRHADISKEATRFMQAAFAHAVDTYFAP